MITINPYAIYAEFLDNFLTIIQDKEARNHATLVSSFLRVGVLNSTITTNDSSIPLSAAVKSGLADENGNFLTASDKAKQINFTFDKARSTMPLERLGVDCSKLSEIQKLIFITACQEAMNRIIAGPLKQCAANLHNVTDDEQQCFIRGLIQETDKKAFERIAKNIKFIQGSKTLTSESIVSINRQRRIFNQMTIKDTNVNIKDEEFSVAQDPEPAVLSLPQRVLLLDELIPTLTLDITLLSAEEESEHQAKLKLLQLYATILAMTKNNAWQVKAQWLRIGNLIQVGEREIALPNSASEIMNVISAELAKKHKADYKQTLLKVQAIASNYEQDWYTWTRNKLPYFAASEALKELLIEILKIDVEGVASVQTNKTSPTVTKTTPYGYNFWGKEKEKDVSSSSSSSVNPLPKGLE